MAWLSIDGGTSLIKAATFDGDGRRLSLCRERTEVVHPQPGWSEQDMDEVWAVTVRVARQAIAACGQPVTGIVTTAQGDGCWLVDEAGRPTGNAILWNDGRAAAMVSAWQTAGVLERTFRRSGSVAYPGLPNAILAWMDRHEPQRLAAARWALTANGWLFAQLTGRFAADLSDASNPFSDLGEGRYAEEVIADYGVTAHAHRLPPILTGKEVVAPVLANAAAQLGVAPEIAVVMAPYDIVATAYGSGAVHAGQACVILGTTICAEVLVASVDRSGAPSGTSIGLDDGLFLRAMPTLTGCEAIEWAAEMLGIGGVDAFERLAAEAGQGSGAPFFLPYLSPAGERSPFLAPEAHGSFHGLSLGTKRSEIARAVYEAMCFTIRECLEAATSEPVQQLRVCGGGAQSAFWCQMIADVTGVTVARAADGETGARGAFLFAMVATGEVDGMSEAARRFLDAPESFRPSLEAHALYASRFEVFGRVRDLARAQWQLLAERR